MKRAVHRGAFYYPCCAAWLQTKSKKALMGMAVLNWGMCYPHQWKIPSVSQLLQEALSMEQQSCGKHQLRIHSEKDQHLGQSIMKPRQSEETSSPTFFSKCGAARCRKIRTAKKRLSIVKVHGSLMSKIFLYCILFHSMSILKPLTKP